MSLQQVQEYIKNYNRAVYRVVACGRMAPTERRFADFEGSIDFRFPDDFREFSMSALGGLYLEVSDELWTRPLEEDDETWMGLYNIRIFGIAVGIPDLLDQRREINALPAIETDLIPFMARGDEGERYCFDLDHQIVRWSPQDAGREIIKGSFYPFLMNEINELEERWEQYQEARKKKKKKKKRKAKK